MDLHTLLTLSIVLGVAAAPFIFVYFHHKRKQREFRKELADLPGQIHPHFSHFEIWRSTYAIGIEKHSDSLCYINRNKNEKSCISLSEIESCRVFSGSKGTQGRNVTGGAVTRLDMVISFIDKTIPEKYLELFDSVEYITVDGEIELAEKWRSYINSAIKKHK